MGRRVRALHSAACNVTFTSWRSSLRTIVSVIVSPTCVAIQNREDVFAAIHFFAVDGEDDVAESDVAGTVALGALQARRWRRNCSASP